MSDPEFEWPHSEVCRCEDCTGEENRAMAEDILADLDLAGIGLQSL